MQAPGSLHPAEDQQQSGPGCRTQARSVQWTVDQARRFFFLFSWALALYSTRPHSHPLICLASYYHCVCICNLQSTANKKQCSVCLSIMILAKPTRPSQSTANNMKQDLHMSLHHFLFYFSNMFFFITAPAIEYYDRGRANLQKL